MNIWNICLTHDPAFGGLYRGINDFAEALNAPILSFDDGRRERTGLRDRAVRIPMGRRRWNRDCHLVPKTAAVRASETITGADLLIVHSLFRGHALWAASWAKRTGKPYWVVPHGCLASWSLGQRRLAKKAWLAFGGRRCLADASRVIFSTQRGLEDCISFAHAANRVAVHWPVQTPLRVDSTASRKAFRERHRIPADAAALLFVGRLHTVKRPMHAVEAFCQSETGQVHLVLVGPEDDVTAKAVLRTVPHHKRRQVHLVGELNGDELADAYHAADGFLSLSFQENFGYATAEAVAYGLPVILSKGHDLAYDLPKSASGGIACGWLLPDDTSATAAKAISEWASLATKRSSALRAMGTTGSTWAKDALSREHFRLRLQSLL